MFLMSKSEITGILDELEITDYYIEVDMNGAMVIALSPQYDNKLDQLKKKISQRDSVRTPDDVYKLDEILFPVKRIIIDDDDDEDTIEAFKNQGFNYSDYSQQLNTWKPINKKKEVEQSKSPNRPPRITFYSYKGGVGRSTSLAIVARLLAKEGFKVAVIDLDLEAPGVNSLLLTKPKTAPFGVVDYLFHAPWIRDKMDEKRFISQYVVREEVGRKNNEPGQLIVMSAGGTVVKYLDEQTSLLFDDDEVEIGLDPNYVNKLGYIDFDVYTRQSQNVFEFLLEDIAKYTKADIILMDARTGISNVSGALINQFSDYFSFHIQDNRQNREGIEFIAQSIGNKKLEDILWSYTKMPRDYSKESSDLLDFICRKFKNDKKQSHKLNFDYLPYDSGLEDITASELKGFIDSRKKTVLSAYEDLTQRIMSIAKINKDPFSYVDKSDRDMIISSLLNLTREFSPTTPYIAQRFLSRDLETYIGFPGSGKKTLKNFINKFRDEEIQVVSYENWDMNNKGIHHTMSHTIFLDWNFQESMQAICKWFLSSDELFQWLVENPLFISKVSEFELQEMRENPCYELDDDIVEEILRFILGGKDTLGLTGIRCLFSVLQYRAKHVLPRDLIQGVSLYLNYFGKSALKRNSSSSLFPMMGPLPRFYRKIFSPIGEGKIKWLKTIDEKLYQLVLVYINISDDENVGILNYAEAKEEFKKLLQISDEELNSILKKAFDMEILSLSMKRYYKDEVIMEKLVLGPVYRHIPAKKE
ncbi:AAA family ATPase [Bacillus cereus]|uniref:KGGVGR-motif variant AAA ATPase n=1 Tax=Bacillus cereus TaxID=1396 RepID=UPI0027D2E764|nr:P-loop NTPase [Bacillus cereus]MCU5603691.1 AAA family ATPase [Bacillus cereus]